MSDGKQLELFNETGDKELASIDRLFQDVKRYRKCSEFKKKLDFYSNFPYLGVYNSELVAMQRPGARFVLTAKNWEKKYQRKIKTNARPLIILVPFYPVDFLFDISDTKPIDSNKKDNKDVIEQIISRFQASCYHDTSFYMNRLKDNLPKHGIHLNRNYNTGSEILSEIRADQSETLYVQVYKDFRVEFKNYFTISVSPRANESETLAAVFHELGHLFCHHLNHSWCKDRSFTKEIKEFEAEVVSYLVCRRLGIESNSIIYLANYLEANDNIPPISIERVFHAVDIVQNIASDYLGITECLLYKNDSAFKAIVDEEREKRKKKKENLKSFLNHKL